RALLFVGGTPKIALPGCPIHDEGAWVVQPAVDVGDGDPGPLELDKERHFVLEVPRDNGVDSVTPHAQGQHSAVAFDVGEPYRPPPGLAGDGGHLAADTFLEPFHHASKLILERTMKAMRRGGHLVPTVS